MDQVRELGTLAGLHAPLLRHGVVFELAAFITQ